jgi:hypothetical protein
MLPKYVNFINKSSIIYFNKKINMIKIVCVLEVYLNQDFVQQHKDVRTALGQNKKHRLVKTTLSQTVSTAAGCS